MTQNSERENSQQQSNTEAFKADSLMVVVDFRQESHHALPRAFDLMKKFGSRLTLATCVYQNIVDIIPATSGLDWKTIRDEALADYENKLRELATELCRETMDNEALEGIWESIDYEVVWDKSFHHGLVNLVKRQKFDLIVKTAHHHSTLKKLFFTPTDWHLLRETETNVLFVKKGAWPSSTSIMGAINIESDEQHQILNREIVETTVKLASLCQSEARILNVFPWPAVDLDKFKYLFDKKDQFLDIKNQHKNAVESYVEGYPELAGNVIIAEGLEPEETIPELIKSTYSDLLVMGCVGRSGLPGAVIGNTAEKILDQLDCEVLVLQ